MESLGQRRRLEVRKKATLRCYTTSHLHQVFFDFARIFSLFSFVFRTSNFWSLRNLIKQLFHLCLLDMRLVTANSALRASLAIYHLISNARSWNNCWWIFPETSSRGIFTNIHESEANNCFSIITQVIIEIPIKQRDVKIYHRLQKFLKGKSDAYK